MKKPLVIHVDEKDNVLGFVPKLEAHQTGILHRAISILVFNSDGDWMLQKRADHKYHSAGLWSNTCCSHPFPHEDIKDAAIRRLKEEMGLSCELVKEFSFIYNAEFDNGLVEHELDHVFIGISDDFPNPNPAEASEWRMISDEELDNEIRLSPEKFSEWFKLIIPKVENYFELKKQ